MSPIPNRLRRFRKSRGLSQKDVAQILGFRNSGMISRWEKGQVLPSTENAFKLALVYRTLTDTLYMDFLETLKGELQKREDALAQGKLHA